MDPTTQKIHKTHQALIQFVFELEDMIEDTERHATNLQDKCDQMTMDYERSFQILRRGGRFLEGVYILSVLASVGFFGAALVGAFEAPVFFWIIVTPVLMFTAWIIPSNIRRFGTPLGLDHSYREWRDQGIEKIQQWQDTRLPDIQKHRRYLELELAFALDDLSHFNEVCTMYKRDHVN